MLLICVYINLTNNHEILYIVYRAVNVLNCTENTNYHEDKWVNRTMSKREYCITFHITHIFASINIAVQLIQFSVSYWTAIENRQMFPDRWESEAKCMTQNVMISFSVWFFVFYCLLYCLMHYRFYWMGQRYLIEYFHWKILLFQGKIHMFVFHWIITLTCQRKISGVFCQYWLYSQSFNACSL